AQPSAKMAVARRENRLRRPPRTPLRFAKKSALRRPRPKGARRRRRGRLQRAAPTRRNERSTPRPPPSVANLERDSKRRGKGDPTRRGRITRGRISFEIRFERRRHWLIRHPGRISLEIRYGKR